MLQRRSRDFNTHPRFLHVKFTSRCVRGKSGLLRLATSPRCTNPLGPARDRPASLGCHLLFLCDSHLARRRQRKATEPPLEPPCGLRCVPRYLGAVGSTSHSSTAHGTLDAGCRSLLLLSDPGTEAGQRQLCRRPPSVTVCAHRLRSAGRLWCGGAANDPMRVPLGGARDIAARSSHSEQRKAHHDVAIDDDAIDCFCADSAAISPQ